MTNDMPSGFWQGVEQFNRGDYYDCHDTLEALWMEASEPDRSFYQGILQLAVALYHLKNHNQRGATILLGEGSNRLQRYRPNYGNIDVDALLDQSTQFLTVLQQTDLTQHPDYKIGNLVLKVNQLGDDAGCNGQDAIPQPENLIATQSIAQGQNESNPNKIDLTTIKYDPDAIPIWELAARLAAKVPDEEWAKLPTDLARNFDYYQQQRNDS